MRAYRASQESVYPRWRGEHAATSRSNLSQSGLSPLARGTRDNRRCRPLMARFIPAGAGNTLSPCLLPARRAVYPRWRGEHCWSVSSIFKRSGLSPLARGTHRNNGRSLILRRFIPAGAGNTSPARLLVCYWSVYPRWRGEHSLT